MRRPGAKWLSHVWKTTLVIRDVAQMELPKLAPLYADSITVLSEGGGSGDVDVVKPWQ